MMFFRFLLVGGAGLVLDAGLTHFLVLANMPPWLARAPAIVLAMCFTWLANRYFTYEVRCSRSAHEAMRYAVIAIVMAGLNYSIYLGLVTRGLLPVAAVVLATAFQAGLSFYAYRHLVFQEPSSRKLQGRAVSDRPRV